MSRRSAVEPVCEAPDESLMARYAAGDIEAFEELFRRYEPRAYAFFVKRTRSRERAEDLYQELFLRIHRARQVYDPARPFAAWLFRIAYRLLVDDVRRTYRGRQMPLETPDLRDAEDVERTVCDRSEVEALLVRLRPAERYVLVHSKIDGLDYPELAERIGKSVDAVKKLASRAMQRARSTQPA